MRGFILGTLATAVAFAVMTFLLKPNIAYTGEIGGLIVLALPIRMATLGLIGFVINAAMLLLVAWLASLVHIDFSVGGFPPKFSIDTITWAIVGSIVLSIISTIIGKFVPD